MIIPRLPNTFLVQRVLQLTIVGLMFRFLNALYKIVPSLVRKEK